MYKSNLEELYLNSPSVFLINIYQVSFLFLNCFFIISCLFFWQKKKKSIFFILPSQVGNIFQRAKPLVDGSGAVQNVCITCCCCCCCSWNSFYYNVRSIFSEYNRIPKTKYSYGYLSFLVLNISFFPFFDFRNIAEIRTVADNYLSEREREKGTPNP